MILEFNDSYYFNRREPVVKTSFLRRRKRSARILRSKSKKNDEHVHHADPVQDVDPVEGIFE